jgi:hypothetical protein
MSSLSFNTMINFLNMISRNPNIVRTIRIRVSKILKTTSRLLERE